MHILLPKTRAQLWRALLTCCVAACFAATFSACTPADTSARSPAEQPVDSQLLARADQGRTMGKASAALWMLIVSDFQCPWCKMWHDSTFAGIKRDYVDSGKLRVAYVNFPLGIHANAWPSAIAAMCASAQGRFWEAQDRIFQTQKVWEKLPKPEAYLDSLAIASGAQEAPLRECTAKRQVLSLIQADQARANQSGASTTPTFFIDHARIEGAEKLPLFRHVIDSVLAAHAKAK